MPVFGARIPRGSSRSSCADILTTQTQSRPVASRRSLCFGRMRNPSLIDAALAPNVTRRAGRGRLLALGLGRDSSDERVLAGSLVEGRQPTSSGAPMMSSGSGQASASPPTPCSVIRPIPFFARARDHRGEFLPRLLAVVADGLAQQQDAGIAVAARDPVTDQAQLAGVAGARRTCGRDQRFLVDAFTEFAADVEAGCVRALLFLRREGGLEPRHAVGWPIREQQHLRQLRDAAGLHGPRHGAAQPHDPRRIDNRSVTAQCRCSAA